MKIIDPMIIWVMQYAKLFGFAKSNEIFAIELLTKSKIKTKNCKQNSLSVSVEAFSKSIWFQGDIILPKCDTKSHTIAHFWLHKCNESHDVWHAMQIDKINN